MRLAVVLVLGMAVACDRRTSSGRGPDTAPIIMLSDIPDGGTLITGEAELHAEPIEQNPGSETVRIKLAVGPPTRATVVWGRKKLGDLVPGKMVLQIERPRGSGPLDVSIKAAGFLPHHARLFTDRDDRLSVRLVRGTPVGGP